MLNQQKLPSPGNKSHQIYILSDPRDNTVRTEAIKIGLTGGIHNVFVLSTIIMCFAFVALFFLQEIPLSSDRKAAMRTEGLEDAESAMVSVVTLE